MERAAGSESPRDVDRGKQGAAADGAARAGAVVKAKLSLNLVSALVCRS